MKLIAGLILAAVAAPAPQIQYFRYQVPVEVPAGANGQSCAVLEPALLGHAAAGLADARLYRDGVEEPYVVHSDSPAPAQAVSVQAVNQGTRAGKAVFDAAMPEGAYRDLELTVAGHDFIAAVTVFGGQQKQNVATRIGTYTIFDLTAQRLGRSTVLHLPESDFPFLHFEVDGPLAAGQFQGITVGRPAAAQQRYITVAESAHVEQKGRRTSVEFAVPANVPVDRIVFAPPATPANFSRDVEVTVSAVASTKDAAVLTAGPWTMMGNIHRIHRVQSGHRLDDEQLTINTPDGANSLPTRWTISIENGDDAPIALVSVVLQMTERKVCFEAAAGAHYALYYGDPALWAPRYDYASWFAPRADAVAAVFGGEQANPVFKPRPDERPFTEKHPLLLWAALLFIVLLLAWVTLRTAGGMQRPTGMQ